MGALWGNTKTLDAAEKLLPSVHRDLRDLPGTVTLFSEELISQ